VYIVRKYEVYLYKLQKQVKKKQVHVYGQLS
jgi:hypothetical protein